MKKPPRTKRSSVTPGDAAERAVVRAALRAFRTAKTVLPKARDPKASREAMATIFQQTDELARLVVAAAEEDAADEEDEVVVDGVRWRAVGAFDKTYQSVRGPIRVRRRLYRQKRNGPTRCFYDERRGVMEGLYFADLGRAVVMTVADVPADAAKRILESVTGHPLFSDNYFCRSATTTFAGGAVLTARSEDEGGGLHAHGRAGQVAEAEDDREQDAGNSGGSSRHERSECADVAGGPVAVRDETRTVVADAV